MDIYHLLHCDESESLDFKECFHSNTVGFIHDILCLANSYTENDRYLVFGIKDDKTLVGVESDENKKNNAQIQDMLRQANFNRIPSIKLEYIDIQGHKIAVLTIKNRPDKPFYLTKDKKVGKQTIRAGVIYTRLGDTNIPLQETAPEDHIELMWRERFGLGLDPLSMLIRLSEEKENWVESCSGSEYCIYHKYFPEFTIVKGEKSMHDYRENWVQKFPDPTAWSYYVEVRYHATVLKRLLFVSCDGGRYHLPAPIRHGSGNEWVIKTDTLEYKISKLYFQYHPLPGALSGRGVRLIPEDPEFS